jgi:predicted ester cyclase
MAGEEARDVVLRFNATMREFWRTGNTGLFDGLLSPDYVQHWPGFPSDREGYLQTLLKFRAAFPDLAKTPEDLFAHGDRVVDRVSVRATHTGSLRGEEPTGRQITLTEIHIARVADGMVVERWGEWDLLGFLQQIGVMPPTPPGS